MDKNSLKLGTGVDVQEAKGVSPKSPEVTTEVIQAKESIARNIDQAAEDSDGQFSEQTKKDSGKYTTQTADDRVIRPNSGIKAVPSVLEMKAQTIAAIEIELAKTQQEIKEALSSKVVPFELNEKVRRARFLNGILGELKRAVRLAEDFVKNLWKQYVQEKKG